MINRITKKIKRLSVPVRYLIWALIFQLGIFPSLAYALPQGGQTIAGSATILQPNAASLQINQTSDKAIINWQGFSIGARESVQFVQPGASSIAYNKVVGMNPSVILGNLSANGQVFLSNGSGIIFGQGSSVNVGGLMATTLNLANSDFLNSIYKFTQDPSRPLASVINQGTINARYVGLLAPAVLNSGTITANLGSVALASGTAATLDFSGDGLINFALTDRVAGNVMDTQGNILKDRVSNSGFIQADGGRVTLSALSARDVIRNVVNNEGIIRANTVMQKDGAIYLFGGDTGIVENSGTLSASGRNAGEKGGTVNILGENIVLTGNARVDVSGDAGGGTVLIGGDTQGTGPTPTSTHVYIDQNATVNADAMSNGDGGKLIVFSTDGTGIYGQLSARGGILSGNGGFIETSGKKFFEITTLPDITAPHGKGGSWLIDPDNIDIVAGSGNFSINSASPFSSSNYTASLGVNLLLAALTGGASVTITTANTSMTSGTGVGIFGLTGNSNVGYGDITLRTPLNYVGTGSNSLTFNALRNINILDNIYTSGTSSSDKLNLTFNTNQGGGGTGTLYIAAGKTVNTNGGTLNISATALNLSETNINHEWTPTAYLTANISGTSTLISSATTGGVIGYGIPAGATGTISTGSGAITIYPATSGETVGVGGGAGTFSIPNTVLANLTTTGGLTIGDSIYTGNITVDGVTSSALANVTGGVTLTATSSTNHPSVTFSGTASTIPEALTINADQGININTNLATSGTFTGNADYNNSGNSSSIFTVATDSTLNSSNSSMSIQGYGLSLVGNLNSGTGSIKIFPSVVGETIGIGDGAGTFAFANHTGGNITTSGGLTIGDSTYTGNVTIADASPPSSITGGITVMATSTTNHPSITVSGTSIMSPTTFTLNADRGITINTDVRLAGSLTLNADYNSSGNASSIVTLASGNNLITTGNIAITSSNALGASASASNLFSGETCTWNGSSCGSSSSPATGLSIPTFFSIPTTFTPPTSSDTSTATSTTPSTTPPIITTPVQQQITQAIQATSSFVTAFSQAATKPGC